MIPYAFHPEAEAELVDAALFYESRVDGLGRSFAAEVQRTVASIPMLAHPLICWFVEFWSHGFRTQWFIGTINNRFSFSPLLICIAGRAIGGVASSALATRSTGSAGTGILSGERRWRRAG